MALKTAIKWTDHTFNIVWGCTKVSPGCKNCYADTLASRYGHDVWSPGKPRRTFGEKHWREPIKWNRSAERDGERRNVFCSSMCDIFEDHPTTQTELQKLWPLITATPSLDWQLLTKRAERIVLGLPPDWGCGYPNTWLGVSIENNDYVERADHLRRIPATVRFISYEPALGPLDRLDLTGIDWVIFGGESGHYFRKHEDDWARATFRRCRDAGVAFFFKQSSGLYPGRGELDGQTPRDFPKPRVITTSPLSDPNECGLYIGLDIDPPGQTKASYGWPPGSAPLLPPLPPRGSSRHRLRVQQLLRTASHTAIDGLFESSLPPIV
jgi:protein gp37